MYIKMNTIIAVCLAIHHVTKQQIIKKVIDMFVILLMTRMITDINHTLYVSGLILNSLS